MSDLLAAGMLPMAVLLLVLVVALALAGAVLYRQRSASATTGAAASNNIEPPVVLPHFSLDVPDAPGNPAYRVRRDPVDDEAPAAAVAWDEPAAQYGRTEPPDDSIGSRMTERHAAAAEREPGPVEDARAAAVMRRTAAAEGYARQLMAETGTELRSMSAERPDLTGAARAPEHLAYSPPLRITPPQQPVREARLQAPAETLAPLTAAAPSPPVVAPRRDEARRQPGAPRRLTPAQTQALRAALAQLQAQAPELVNARLGAAGRALVAQAMAALQRAAPPEFDDGDLPAAAPVAPPSPAAPPALLRQPLPELPPEPSPLADAADPPAQPPPEPLLRRPLPALVPEPSADFTALHMTGQGMAFVPLLPMYIPVGPDIPGRTRPAIPKDASGAPQFALNQPSPSGETGRHLTEEASRALRAALERISEQVPTVSITRLGAPEARSYANELVGVFKQAGIGVIGNMIGELSPPVYGLVVYEDDSDRPLSEALRTVGSPLETRPLGGRATRRIIVGLQPPPP
jgi:hypothetical protein